ncbi:hypothetical protein [Bifidobacterium animalis]|uniref:hypothetical protein n=1 Tax=Bifidobacterium animalis TaxID=28025 RepID=UPI0010229C46|nr:hypothetical protein [Bifidobacterium animalis]
MVLINPSNSLKILNSFGLASALAGFIIVQAYEHPNSSANGNQKLRAALSEESAKALGDALQLIGLYTALLMDYWFLISTILVAIVWALWHIGQNVLIMLRVCRCGSRRVGVPFSVFP